jgi:hypothetical protein
MFILPGCRPLPKSETEMVCRAIVKRWQTSAAAREQILGQAQTDDAMGVYPTIPLTYAYLEPWHTGLDVVGGKDISKTTFQLEKADYAVLNKVCQEAKHRCIVYSKSRPPSPEQQAKDLYDLLSIMLIVRHLAGDLS